MTRPPPKKHTHRHRRRARAPRWQVARSIARTPLKRARATELFIAAAVLMRERQRQRRQRRRRQRWRRQQAGARSFNSGRRRRSRFSINASFSEMDYVPRLVSATQLEPLVEDANDFAHVSGGGGGDCERQRARRSSVQRPGDSNARAQGSQRCLPVSAVRAAAVAFSAAPLRRGDGRSAGGPSAATFVCERRAPPPRLQIATVNAQLSGYELALLQDRVRRRLSHSGACGRRASRRVHPAHGRLLPKNVSRGRRHPPLRRLPRAA